MAIAPLPDPKSAQGPSSGLSWLLIAYAQDWLMESWAQLTHSITQQRFHDRGESHAVVSLLQSVTVCHRLWA